MAAALSVPSDSNVHTPLAVTGTGWTVDASVTISIPEDNIVVTAVTDPSGDWDIASAFQWFPTKAGRYTVSVTDGTDTLEQSVQIWAG